MLLKHKTQQPLSLALVGDCWRGKDRDFNKTRNFV